MARSTFGAGVTERYYRRTRLLSLAMAIVLRGLWEGMGLKDRREVPAGVVKQWLDAVIDLLRNFHEMSLAMAQDYFVTFTLSDLPEVPLQVVGETRQVWSGLDVQLDDDIDSLSKVMLTGRVAQVADASVKVVESTAAAVEHEVGGLPNVAEVMGEEWAEVDGDQGDDPLALMPDPNPMDETNVRNRLLYKGPKGFEKKAQEIDALTRVNGDDTPGALEETKQLRIEKQADRSWVRATNAAVTMVDAGQDFVEAATAMHGLGYVRALGPNPCSFCVALAAQGVIYSQGAWDESNARFRTWTGSAGGVMHGGEAKVHDGCQCRLEPVSLVDPTPTLPQSVRRAQRLWQDAEGYMKDLAWPDKLAAFREAYHGGDIDRELLQEMERDRLSTERDELRLTIPSLMMQIAHMEDYMAETGTDVSRQINFEKEQLEYYLQKWDKRDYGKTDWTREYQWVVERAAAIWPPDKFDEAIAEYAEMDDGTEATEFARQAPHFMKWQRDQAPDAWKTPELYWDVRPAEEVDNPDIFIDPLMPEFTD
ncbi:hypothetical protein WU87_01130 [Corynebacterium minutissimum]|uniref:Uncharacterized protein n=1 Tax=Corynebacterium minutissimum TaxID=38301 RepID=A0ACC4UDR8_9CORY|nr:hypothetical protein WU87_01130 [Corynebacterium minutissimum]